MAAWRVHPSLVSFRIERTLGIHQQGVLNSSIVGTVSMYCPPVRTRPLTEFIETLRRAIYSSRTLQPLAFERVSVRCCRSAPGSSIGSPGASFILGNSCKTRIIPHEVNMRPKSSEPCVNTEPIDDFVF
jgi:hypothetical protein